jgi:predicted DNA binding CopG/RHH family protein
MARQQRRTTMTSKKIPSFKNDEEERAFWAKHGIEELADQLEELDVELRPARTEQIAVRLYEEDLEALRQLAKRKGVGHTTLARSILEQWLGRVREQLAAGRPRRPRHAT